VIRYTVERRKRRRAMRELIHQYLKQTLSDYGRLILKPRPIGLRLVTKDRIIQDASQNFVYRLLIDKGVFTNFADEYPVFVVVYNYDKIPYNVPLTGKCWIGFCEEIASVHLKNLTSDEVQTYIRYAFAHEITHIMEDLIIEKRPDLYDKAFEQNAHKHEDVREFTSETLAEDVAYMVSDREKVAPIVQKIWGGVFKKASTML
jgi:hypothetical protein